MKQIGSHARRRPANRLGGRRQLFGTAALCIAALTGFFYLDGPSAPALEGTPAPFEAQNAREISTAGINDALTALSPATPDFPFEPLVEAKLARRAAPLPKADNSTWQPVQVARGDNLSLIFSRLKLSKSDLHTIASLDLAKPVLRRLKPGQLIRFQTIDDRLEGLVVEIDDLNSLVIERKDAAFTARSEAIIPEIRVVSAMAEINHSLFLDGQKAGLADSTIMDLTEIFGWDIDFALDIRAHDYFSVIYEQAYKDGELIKQGRILAAEFINRGRSLRAVLFTDEDGNSEYYSDDGDAMRKAFLRTPVNFTRISSHFNMQRKHPVLNTIRAHKGVDYAAPSGTPIRATANGKITFVGRKGGYGNVVQMQHGQAYSTLYAHMSRFRKGLQRGASVKQGQIVGYVGKSGLATGPHLHYEFRVNGTHRNPLTVDLPKAMPIEKRYLAAFRAHAAPLLDRLDTMVADFNGPTTDTKMVARVETSVLPALAPESTGH